MNKPTAPTITLEIPEDTFSALVSTIEDKIKASIRENPEKYFPKSTGPQNDIVFYTTDQVAKKLRVTPQMVRSLCKQGKLGFYRPGGRAMLISEEQFNTYLETAKNKNFED